jgi:hypothetical protein
MREMIRGRLGEVESASNLCQVNQQVIREVFGAFWQGPCILPEQTRLW